LRVVAAVNPSVTGSSGDGTSANDLKAGGCRGAVRYEVLFNEIETKVQLLDPPDRILHLSAGDRFRLPKARQIYLQFNTAREASFLLGVRHATSTCCAPRPTASVSVYRLKTAQCA
jgi:hypothetical protein